MEPRLKLHTYKSNIIDNMQRKHILLVSKAKHSLTSQVKIRGYIQAKSSRQHDRGAGILRNADCGMRKVVKG